MQLDPNEIDMDKRKILLRDFQNGLTNVQAKDNIVKNFGDCVGYGDRTCQRWFTKFQSGDFDLNKKPRDKTKKNKDYNVKKKKRSTRTIKVNEVKFKQQDLPDPKKIEKNTTVQKLIKSKPELTISKVLTSSGAEVNKPPLESNIITKREINPPIKSIALVNMTSSSVQSKTNKVPLEMPKLRPRRPRSKGIEIQLSVSAANRMNPKTLTENHSIGEGDKAKIRAETGKQTITENPRSKEVTVQFQNLSPEVAKNTVRKTTKAAYKGVAPIYVKTQNTMLKIVNVAHVDSISPEKNNTSEQTIAEIPNKRGTLPQVSPLNNQKGIIYLNPQEIFRQSFGGFENSVARPSPYVKSAHQIQTTSKSFIHLLGPNVRPPPSERQDSVILCDSDESDEDILFPENIRLPAPKIKTETYTTYFDLERGKPIQINGEEPILPKPAIPMIEID